MKYKIPKPRECGSRTFETMERESDFIEVEKLPEDYAPHKGIARIEVE